jgi:hypothetical protein
MYFYPDYGFAGDVPPADRRTQPWTNEYGITVDRTGVPLSLDGNDRAKRQWVDEFGVTHTVDVPLSDDQQFAVDAVKVAREVAEAMGGNYNRATAVAATELILSGKGAQLVLLDDMDQALARVYPKTRGKALAILNPDPQPQPDLPWSQETQAAIDAMIERWYAEPVPGVPLSRADEEPSSALLWGTAGPYPVGAATTVIDPYAPEVGHRGAATGDTAKERPGRKGRGRRTKAKAKMVRQLINRKWQWVEYDKRDRTVPILHGPEKPPL